MPDTIIEKKKDDVPPVDDSKNTVDKDDATVDGATPAPAATDDKPPAAPEPDIYEAKLEELKQKTGALKEKNEQIQSLKDQLAAKDSTDPGDVAEATELKQQLGEAIESITTLKEEVDELKKRDDSEALKLVKEDRIDRQLDKFTDNPKEKVIIKFMLENKVNKNLPLDEQLQQAFDLTRAEFSRDSKFQAEVERANENAVATVGIKKNRGSGWLPEQQSWAHRVLETDKGRQMFDDLGNK